MTVVLNLTWAIVLLPVVGIGAALLAESPRRAAQTGVAFTALAFAVAVVVLVFRLTHVIPTYENAQTFWDLPATSGVAGVHQPLAGEFPLFWGIRVDPLSVSFMALVLFLSLVTQLHALTSMRGDPGFRRFFWVSALLTSGMLALVASPNLFQLWLGWTVCGVAAWMLAVHHWQRGESVVAATRTFVVLRVADLALLLALIVTFTKFAVAVAQQPTTNGQVTNDPLGFTALTPEWHLGHAGNVAGVGARSLVVIAVLLVVAVAIRAALGPLHVWLSGTLDAPNAALPLVAVSALLPAGILVARTYPLLLEAPHLLTVAALVGAAGAVVGAVLALAHRDVFRIGVFAVSSQAGMALAAFGMGGYSPALFVMFTAAPLAVLYFLAVANLSRGYRTRDLTECSGGRRRMPRTTLAIGGWAIGISGLSLNSYSVLSATFRRTLPVGGHPSIAVATLVAVAVLATMALTSLYAFRVYFTVAGGEPARRRGFDVTRLREVEPSLWRPAFVALLGAAVATVVGIPGVSGFRVGSSRVPGLTFSHFVFYGPFRQQLALDVVALALAALVGAGGALGAWWLNRTVRTGTAAGLRSRLATAGARIAAAGPAERLAAIVPRGFLRAGETLAGFDAEVLEPVAASLGETAGLVSGWTSRLRRTRMGASAATGVAVVAVLLAATVLAATGHFPVTTR